MRAWPFLASLFAHRALHRLNFRSPSSFTNTTASRGIFSVISRCSKTYFSNSNSRSRFFLSSSFRLPSWPFSSYPGDPDKRYVAALARLPFKSFKPFNRCAPFHACGSSRFNGSNVQRQIRPFGNFHVSRFSKRRNENLGPSFSLFAWF